MALPSPAGRGKPERLEDTTRYGKGPMIEQQTYPDVGKVEVKKFAPGKFGGRTIKAGK